MAPGSWLPFPASFEQRPPQAEPENEPDLEDGDAIDQHYIEKIRTIHKFNEEDDLSLAPEGLFQPSKRPEAPVNDDLVQKLLQMHEADALVNEYRDMSSNFPFVIIRPDITAQQLHTEKPMLLLAVLTVASWRDHQRQMALDTIYRNQLAHRTMIAPRRTLGLVQSVLVYLSWSVPLAHKTMLGG